MADDASWPLRVVPSIRSGFLDRVAEDRAVMAEPNKALYFLVQPDQDGLRAAITRPAEMARGIQEIRRPNNGACWCVLMAFVAQVARAALPTDARARPARVPLD